MKPIARVALTCLFLLTAATSAATAASTDLGFTAEQAAKGRALYSRHCATCHGPRLQGEHVTPALVGQRFDNLWRGKSADVLAFHLRRMPPEPIDSPGGLGDEVYSSILAHILASNGFEPGETALPTDLDELEGVTIPTLDGAEVDPYAPAVAAGESEILKALEPVTADMLKEPPAEDWLQNGRTYSGHAHSPLKDLNRDTIDFLSIAWRAPLRSGPNMPNLLVHGGVMFLHTFPDTVIALDATNGDVLWSHAYDTTGQPSQKMGLALAGNKVLAPTSDKHVIALDMKTGELLWDHEIELPTPQMRPAYQLRSPPLVVGDKVIQGVTASFVPKGGFAVALDLETGEKVWQFDSIARPGEAYGETWNDVPLEKRSGGSIWQQGTYDPELDRVFLGIAPTYDTGPLLHPVDKEGVSSEAMYTNCTVALDPKTGKLDWCYQHVANDQWDLDWAFERQLVDVDINDRPRRTVVNIGKMAILEALDAETGAYLFSIDAGIQNVITAIDPETGEKTIDPQRLPDPERPTDICPSAFGARAWPTTSYSPETNQVYAPLTESCMRLGKEGARLLTSGVGIGPASHPASADGKLGRLQAYDLENRKLGWTADLEYPLTTGVLTTAGGLVFVGDLQPSLKAFDDETGELLWEAGLDANPNSGIISYKVDGRQYVAVVVGNFSLQVSAIASHLARTFQEAGKTLEQPKGGAAIWVFGL